jgi:hypothetical protein
MNTGCGRSPDLPVIAITAAREPSLEFRRDILPILSNKCFSCHGPDSSARKAALRLDQREAALRPARSGAVPIQPGKANESEVVRRIFSTDAEERMPPAASHHLLTAGEKELLRCWIEQGAEYSQHWAFVAPVHPPLPVVVERTWVKNEVDAFVLARLEQAGMTPTPPAERATLLRRLSLDLRGVPPSLREVDDFLADTAPDAYERWVERFLRSPLYGEKMAQLWLDLARFGDTSGFHQDSTRQMWLWRDWVIDAFNRNMPYDQFSIEQLAGDLLPNATVAQKIASGFNRNTRFNEEGGVDPEEFVLRYNSDRTQTLGKVWLGLTLGCAECHSHKYDPITQKEFYQLFAYFSGIAEPMVSMNHDQPLPPLLKVARPEQTAALAAYRQEAATIEEALAQERKRGASRASLEALEEELQDLHKKIADTEAAIPSAMICEEMAPPRPAYVLVRGDFQRKGEKVERAVPALLPPLPDGAPHNRLGLARWLFRPEHPLTARVTVNRLWAQLFGSGIVRSLGDLGSQGDYPSHPELLDWLATEFITSGWDIKAILKKIALSNTYRQASTYRQEKLDPENRLLARAPRFRLSAEEIRDSALAVSGLLSAKIGGPSVMPYQPTDYFKGKYEKWHWVPSAGEDQYRRGLYTFWRRTALHPMFTIFDAPDREESCVARPRTNTPLQALVTLNDPTFVEAARVFAQRILLEGPGDLVRRLRFAFRTALARQPTSAELRTLQAAYAEEYERNRQDAEAASRLVSVGTYPRAAQLDVAEHAAWTGVAMMLLNLDEFVMRE